MISEKQKKILAFPYSPYDVLICDGAVRSGKTSVETVAFIDWAMRGFSGQLFGICGKTVEGAIKNIIVPYMSMTYSRRRYMLIWRRTDKILEVRRGSSVNRFEVFGGKDESSYALIQGRTFAVVFLDEVVLMPKSFVNQAIARCSVSGAKIWFSCNPESPRHWFYTDWIKKRAEKNALYLRFGMRDNPSLDEQTLARYESMYDGVFYDRYIRGLWVAAEGLIYRGFANDPKKYTIGDPSRWCAENNTQFSTLTLGVDFGGSRSATKFQATGITPAGTVVALDEEYIDHTQSEIDPDDLCRRYAAFVERVSERYGASVTRADSAEQILIRGLVNTAGKQRLRTQVKNALKLPIRDRIMLALLLMKQGRLYVSDSCPHLIEAFSTAMYDPGKAGDERLDDGTTDVDSLDAFEYSVEPWYKQLVRG